MTGYMKSPFCCYIQAVGFVFSPDVWNKMQYCSSGVHLNGHLPVKFPILPCLVYFYAQLFLVLLTSLLVVVS